MAAQIPLVDFSPFQMEEGVCIGEEATPHQLRVSQQINEACRVHGFVHLTNFGLSKQLYDSVLQKTEELFRDEDLKSNLPLLNRLTNVGFQPYKTENFDEKQRDMDLKESLNLRLHPDIKFDFSCCPPGFEEKISELLQVLQKASQKYALACALALNLPLDSFSTILQEHRKLLLRLNYYPAIQN